MRTTITIHELAGTRRSWTSTHHTDDRADALRRALTKHFGSTHGFRQDSGLPAGYGTIVRNLSGRERGNGSTWAAEVVIGRARVDTEVRS